MADLNLELAPAFFAAVGDLERARVALRDDPAVRYNLADATVTMPSRPVADLSSAARRVFDEVSRFLDSADQAPL